MKKILFATGNPTKAKRFSLGLKKYDIEVLSLKDLNISSKYSSLKKMKQPFFTVLKNSCKTQKTVIYTNSNKN